MCHHRSLFLITFSQFLTLPFLYELLHFDPEPELHEVLADSRWITAPTTSRVAARGGSGLGTDCGKRCAKKKNIYIYMYIFSVIHSSCFYHCPIIVCQSFFHCSSSYFSSFPIKFSSYSIFHMIHFHTILSFPEFSNIFHQFCSYVPFLSFFLCLAFSSIFMFFLVSDCFFQAAGGIPPAAKFNAKDE